LFIIRPITAGITQLNVIRPDLKNHGTDIFLDTEETVLNRAADFVWKGLNAIVHLLKTSYEKGIKVCGKEKTKMEERQQRSERLSLYDITIIPKTVY